MSKHKHNFVPVGVTWRKYWIAPEIQQPQHVVLACTCGEVKLVKARLVGAKKK